MRKDVKLGFAVGGVLLAVLIVYVLVVPGGKDQRLSDAQGESSQADGGVKLEPVAPTTQPGALAQNTQPPPAPPVTFDPPAGGTDPFEQPADEAVASNDPGRKDLDWSKLLNDPRAPVLMATPENAAGQTSSASGDAAPVDAGDAAALPDITKPGPTPIVPPAAPKADEASVPPPVTTEGGTLAQQPQPESPAPPAVDPSTPGSETPVAGNSTENTGGDAPASPAAAQQMHTVESGESFSSIAIRYYSNANLYPALMRANPSIDPVKLRPGMKVVVPPLSEIRPPAPAAPAAAERAAGTTVSGDTAQVSSTKVEAAVDPATQYRVQAGDSLYSIAKKLYGRGDRSTKLYEANKASIGEDINRLKVGQVLHLPDPPTNLQAAR